MALGDLLKKFMGNKAQRDMKEISPEVEKIKAAYENIKTLSNDELRERVVNVEVINEAQDKTISDLQALRQQDAAVMAGLVTDYAKLSKSDATARKKLSELEKQNANVRDYLDQPLPPELVCMLNNSCTAAQASGAGSQGSAAEQPAGTVQKARPSGHSK